MELTVIGSGYVGLVSSACFAEMGFKVTCLDKNIDKIHGLQKGIIPIYEPGLEEMVRKNSHAKRLLFTSSYVEALKHAQVCFIAVDTPVGEGGKCDLKSVKAVSTSIGQIIEHPLIVATKSTVPVGTHKIISSIIHDELKKRGKSFTVEVVSNPEFLKEGCAISDFMKPDRVIIGADSERAEEVMRDIYRPFMLSSDRLIVMDVASAEITKYAANTMLALRISYMNWLSGICEATGANILDVRVGIGSDKRIGSQFLWAGAGFGGSCFPKDILALRSIAEELELPTHLIDAISDINILQKQKIGKKILSYLNNTGGAAGKHIAILGLAFKPDTDDMREAPSIVLMEQLLNEGTHLRVYDPVALSNTKDIFGEHPQITYCQSEQEAIQGSHSIALITEWKQFRLLNWKELKSSMKGHGFFDGRNQYNPDEMSKLGFDYFSIGRNPSFAHHTKRGDEDMAILINEPSSHKTSCELNQSGKQSS